MADAAKQLARGEVNGAADRSERTLARLRDLERMLRGTSPDERKRALGELQLEAEQMSEAQHRLSADARRLQQQGRSGSGTSGDTLRRMAGEQERLAERANALRRGMADLSASGKSDQDRAALSDAQGELSRQKVEERMRQAAGSLRAASGQGQGQGQGQPGQQGQASNQTQAQNQTTNQSQRDAGRQSLGKGQPGQAGQQSGDKQTASGNGAGKPGETGEGAGGLDPASLANQQDELARAVDQVAQRMGASVANNADSRKLSDQLAQVRAHRNRLNELGQRMDELSKQNGANGGKPGDASKGNSPGTNGAPNPAQGTNAAANGGKNASGQQAQNGQSGQQGQGQGQGQSQSGQSGQQGQGQQGQGQSGQGGQGGGQTAGNGQGGQGSDANGELARLQAEYSRQLRETQDLLNGLQRDQQGAGGGPGGGYGSSGGYTPVNPEASFARNAPGTEAFKQDYAKWDVLRKDVTFALEQAETSLAQRLSAREGRDRLNAGGDDRPPAEYADSVSRYYRSLAKRAPKS
jgi:hypothetical protein